MSLPRPKRLYRAVELERQAEEPSLTGADTITDIISFLTLLFQLDVHTFSDPFHPESWPAWAGEGGTFSVRQFQLQFDDLGFNQDDTYDDGRPMRGGNISKGHRITIKHVAVDSNDLRFPDLATTQILKPLVQELRVLAHPPLRDHPNIIDLFGVAWEKQLGVLGKHWPTLVIEYASGGNLMEYLTSDQNEIPWSECLSIAGHIAAGILSLHRCGVVHTDLKPENVLMVMGNMGHCVAKISDFAFCIIKSDYHQAEPLPSSLVQLTGCTPRWLAPEGRKGRVLLYQAHMLDVYAFGLIFATIVMRGQDPFAIDVSSHLFLLA